MSVSTQKLPHRVYAINTKYICELRSMHFLKLQKISRANAVHKQPMGHVSIFKAKNKKL